MNKVILLLSLILVQSLAQAASVTGHIQMQRRAGATTQVIVYAEPLETRRVQPGRFKMTQKNKTFSPRVLAIPVGSTVTFPNDDSIFHNVFSLSRPNPFDLGLYRDGDSKDRTFTTAATYRVFCNIHPQMSATILVVPTSYITEVDSLGGYRFDLPAGRYRITAWSERASKPATVDVTVGAEAQTVGELMLDDSQAAEAAHKNKFGLDYPKSAYDPKKN
jgi:plastocyanin